MVKRPAAGFADDLQQLQGEVEADVGQILQLAEQARGAADPAATSTGVSHRARRSKRRPERSIGSAKQSLQAPAPASPVLNVTTRLTQRINELLTEAALRQRLDKATPATRQDIIEAAVLDWLQRHGYADPAI